MAGFVRRGGGWVTYARMTSIDQQQLRAFWDNTLTELRRQPMNASSQGVNSRAPYFAERVTFTSLDGAVITANLSRPAGATGPFPAIVSAPGYGGYEFGAELSEAQRGYIVLQVFPRMQGDSITPPPAPGTKADNAHIVRWIDDGPERYFYRGAYCDIVRGIDYVRSRPDVIADRVAVVGTSQGGMLTLAAAALEPTVRACVAHVPAFCDMRRNTSSLCAALHNDKAEQRLSTFDRFDPLNLAPLIRCPTLLSAGGIDTVCPPETIHAVFNRLSVVKAIFHDPQLKHTSSRAFYAMTWDWVARYL